MKIISSSKSDNNEGLILSLKRERYLTAAASASSNNKAVPVPDPDNLEGSSSTIDTLPETPPASPTPAPRKISLSRKDNIIMPKSHRKLHMGSWLTPRPVMVSMLNNKAVIYMERQQFSEARKSLKKALKIAEKEGQIKGYGSPNKSGHSSQQHTDNNRSNRMQSSGSHALNSQPTAPTPSCSNNSNKHDAQASPARKPSSTSSVFQNDASSDFAAKNAGDDDNNNKTRLKSPLAGAASLVQTALDIVQTNNGDDKQGYNTTTLASHHRYATPNAADCNGSASPVEIMACISVEPSPLAVKSSKHRSEYDEGMDFFRTPFRLDDSNTSLEGTVLFNLGRIAHHQGDLEDAVAWYKRSLVALERRRVALQEENHSAPEDQSSSITLAILGCVAHIQYVRGDHVDALKTYMTANALARSNFGEESMEAAACLNCVGVLHYVMPNGDVQIALDALQTCLKQRLALLGDDHIDVGTTWNNIGRIFFQQGKYEVAMEAYREALRIRRSCQGESVDVAATMFNIGQVYHQQENRDKALQLYHDFLKLAKSHFGEFHRDICIVTTCIGQVLHEKKEYEKALKSFQHALRIGHVALGEVHSEIAITLNKMGNLYYETNDLDSALKAYHEGLAIEKEVLEPGNANVYVTYTNIAEIHKQRSEYKKAQEYYEQVLDLQKEHKADAEEVANTLSSIGYIHHQMEDFEKALEVNQECLRLRREAKGDMDEDVASTLTHIALVLLKLERHDIALEVLTEAYRIRKVISKPNSRDLAFTLYNIALIYHHRGSHEQALAFYLATAEVEKDALGKAHRDLSITYYNIGQIYYQRGEMELALQKFDEALEIEQECFGPEHPTCARTLNEIGNIQLQLGDDEVLHQRSSNLSRCGYAKRTGGCLRIEAVEV
ncbi:MAG: hypothetical protein SGARI_000063 [Bacillariaceae sp.]